MAQKKKKTGNIASCLLSFSDRVLNEFFWVKQWKKLKKYLIISAKAMFLAL
jgi:hypothetical protein